SLIQLRQHTKEQRRHNLKITKDQIFIVIPRVKRYIFDSKDHSKDQIFIAIPRVKHNIIYSRIGRW
ncbi:MAG: hypothetical protein WAK17_25400, partial [Candidatus Nitrosopolaris sp.]